jgi:hypothetical protein
MLWSFVNLKYRCEMVDRIRWRAVIRYRRDAGSVSAEHFLEEIEDLHDLVEHGPHWDTVEKIEVFRINHCTDPTLTVEQTAFISIKSH